MSGRKIEVSSLSKNLICKAILPRVCSNSPSSWRHSSLKKLQCGSQSSSHPQVPILSWKTGQHPHRWGPPQFTSGPAYEFLDFLNPNNLILLLYLGHPWQWLTPGSVIIRKNSYWILPSHSPTTLPILAVLSFMCTTPVLGPHLGFQSLEPLFFYAVSLSCLFPSLPNPENLVSIPSLCYSITMLTS